MTEVKLIPEYQRDAMQRSVDELNTGSNVRAELHLYTPSGGSYQWPIYSLGRLRHLGLLAKPQAQFESDINLIKHNGQDKAVLNDVAKDSTCFFDVPKGPVMDHFEQVVTLLDRLRFRPVCVPVVVTAMEYNEPVVLFTPADVGQSLYRLTRSRDRYEVQSIGYVSGVMSTEQMLDQMGDSLRQGCTKIGHFFQFKGGRVTSIPSVLRAIMHVTDERGTMGGDIPLMGSNRTSIPRINYFEYRTCYLQVFEQLAKEAAPSLAATHGVRLTYFTASDTGLRVSIGEYRLREYYAPDVRAVLENQRHELAERLSTDDMRLTVNEARDGDAVTTFPRVTIRWDNQPMDDRVIQLVTLVNAYAEGLEEIYKPHHEGTPCL